MKAMLTRLIDPILAIPTFVRQLPPPVEKLIGDLSDTERVFVGPDLQPAAIVKLIDGATLMGRRDTETTEKQFEKALTKSKAEKYVLRLYITGMTPKSTNAIVNVKKICEEHLSGRYELEVIDIYQQPTLAKGEQIIAAPTLIKKLPLPLRKLIGDMSDTEKFLVGIDLRPKKTVKAKNG